MSIVLAGVVRGCYYFIPHAQKPSKKHLSSRPLKKLPQNLNEQIKGVGKLKQHKSNIGDMLTHLTSNIDFKNPHLT
jgi:hypothetical protein